MHYSKANPRETLTKKKMVTESGAPSIKIVAPKSRTGTKRIKEEFSRGAHNSISRCRVCLQIGEEGEEMASIFDQDADSVCLYEKIESCGGIKILTKHELPTQICKKCHAFLIIAYKFRLICRNSDNYLREFGCKYPSNQSNDGEDRDDGDDDDDHNNTAKRLNSELLKVDTTRSKTEPTTVGQVLQQAGHNVNETQNSIEYEDKSEYTEIWMDEDDNIIDIIVEDYEDVSQAPSSTPTQIHQEKQKDDTSDDVKTKIRDKYTHICEICGNVYPRKDSLEAHMRRHRDERPYECEICSKSFHLNFQLTRHMQKHTGLRPYSCQYCQRAFYDRHTMNLHERIHRNERPYVCDICEKSFTYSSGLSRHILTHTGEKPYSCGICGKRFARAHHLRAHLETLMHQNDPRSKLLLKNIKREVETPGGEEQCFEAAND